MWLTALNLVALFFVFTSPCGFFSLRDFAYPVQQVSIPSLPCPELEKKSQVKDSPQVAVEQSTSQPPETSEISTVPKPPETSLVTPALSEAVLPATGTVSPVLGYHNGTCSLVVEPCHVDGSGTFAAQTFGDIYMRNMWLGGGFK